MNRLDLALMRKAHGPTESMGATVQRRVRGSDHVLQSQRERDRFGRDASGSARTLQQARAAAAGVAQRCFFIPGHVARRTTACQDGLRLARRGRRRRCRRRGEARSPGADAPEMVKVPVHAALQAKTSTPSS